MLILPEEHRRLFKEPFGVLYRSMDEVVPLIEGKDVYTVGDVVTHNLQKKGITPTVAVVDGYTMRSPCNRIPAVHGECIQVKNPAGTHHGRVDLRAGACGQKSPVYDYC